MLWQSSRVALKLHDRADVFLRDVVAPSAPVAEAVMEFFDALGDYDEDAGLDITEAAKGVLMFSVMRGYTLRMASQEPLHLELPDEPPGDCLGALLVESFRDEWFFGVAFPQGAKVWRRLQGPFASVANRMLLETDPSSATWPGEVIDDVLRVGYVACCVDEWFRLEPARRDL